MSEGQTDPPGIDGKPAGEARPKPLLGVEATLRGQSAAVVYAGGLRASQRA